MELLLHPLTTAKRLDVVRARTAMYRTVVQMIV
jgi:hypothetical protein